MKNVHIVSLLLPILSIACGGSADDGAASDIPNAVADDTTGALPNNGGSVDVVRQDRLPLCDLLQCEDIANSCEQSAASRQNSCDRCWHICEDPYAPSNCSDTCSSICDSQIPHSECDARFDRCASAAIAKGCRMPESACGEIRFSERASASDNRTKISTKLHQSTKPTCGACAEKLEASCDPICKSALDRYSACASTEGCSTTPFLNELNECYVDALKNDSQCNQAFTACFDLMP